MIILVLTCLAPFSMIEGMRFPRQDGRYDCVAANGRQTGFIDLSSGNRCKNPKGAFGICINIHNCDPIKELLLTKRQYPDVRDFIAKSQCGWDGSQPKVCCTSDSKENLENEDPIPDATPPNQVPNVGVRSLIPKPGVCGISENKFNRVVGGTNATLGSWPWMAALGYLNTKGKREPDFLCAGALITDRHVLTAAHCITTNKKLIVVRLGDLNLFEDTDGANPIDAKISRTIVHEKYDKRAFVNDIAIVELREPVTYTRNIRPICLPLAREFRAKDFVDRQPFIAGWGSVSFYGPSSPTLLELQIPVVKEEACKKAFSVHRTAVIDRRVICAGNLKGGQDACRGDSGGPLMDYNAEHKGFFQIGVVSYGYKCAEPGFPGVYTRVTEFADWITDKIEQRS